MHAPAQRVVAPFPADDKSGTCTDWADTPIAAMTRLMGESTPPLLPNHGFCVEALGFAAAPCYPQTVFRGDSLEENVMRGKFEIYKDKKGEFRFRLKASNGRVILASEGYKAKSGCTNGIQSVKKNSAKDNLFERSVAKNGKHHFSLKSTNKQVIGTSQMYATATSMEGGIKSVMSHAADAAVDDQT